MRGLTILVVSDDADRLHAALSYAAAGAALGLGVRVHLHEAAVVLLVPPLSAPGDERRTAAGLPGLATLFEDAIALGVDVSVCQSGLSLGGLNLTDLDHRIAADGPVGLLASAENDRMLIF